MRYIFFLVLIAGTLCLQATSQNKSVSTVGELADFESNQFKVRISGRIEMLTSDPSKNRSFGFLDTFNRIDGKWQVIAHHFAPESSIPNSSSDAVARNLIALEKQLAQAELTNDRYVFDKIIAPEFVSTDSKAVVRD